MRIIYCQFKEDVILENRDTYHNYFIVIDEFTGESFYVKTGIQSSFSDFYRYQEPGFFRLIKKRIKYRWGGKSVYKPQNVSASEMMIFREKYPELFI